jgi:V/A-type H+/Na+-transporting ATPase subunit I
LQLLRIKMFIKSDIRRVTIALENSLSHEVYTRLGQEGIIHLARVQAGDVQTDSGIMNEEARTRDIIAGSGFILSALHMETGEEPLPAMTRDTERDALFVSKARRTVDRLQRIRARIQEKENYLFEQIEYAEALSRMGIDPSALKKARLARMVFGRISDIAPELPADERFIIARTGNYVFGAALSKDVPAMLQTLEQNGFIDKTADINGSSLEELKRREGSLRRRMEILDRYTDRFRKEKGPELIRLHNSYKDHEAILKAIRLSAFSSKAMFITGWMDARDRPRLVKLLQKLCGERYILAEERDPNAPVRLRNMRLFKPFELIVKMMGIPANSEIDPTPLAAMTFVLVFGLMFGDLGQGIILAIAGLALRYVAGKKKSEDLGHAGGILFACGLSAALCGILYGNLFSSEHLIPALWIRPAEKIMRLFSATILLGAVIIVIGLCLNIINALINADYVEALLEKKGMAILILYSAIVIMVIRYMSLHLAPEPWQISAFIFVPLLIFCLRGVLGPVLFNAHRPHNVGEYITETIMDVVEIALSMFANTVSFIRVGAFALAHAGLSIVTYTLAGMVDPGLKSAGAIAVIVLGNIFIIGFEGMICGIQSMRLEYYEFFSKFYRGDGVVFSPFILKAKTSEV